MSLKILAAAGLRGSMRIAFDGENTLHYIELREGRFELVGVRI